METEGTGTGGASGSCCPSKTTVDGVTVNPDEKMDSIQLEYTYLLTSQLEAQRRYYEEKLGRVEDQAKIEMEEVTSRARASLDENRQLEARLQAIAKEKASGRGKSALARIFAHS